MNLINYDILSIRKAYFKDCSIDDDFFNSLKDDYNPGFEDWFSRKEDNEVYIHCDEEGGLQGLLYLKEEDESEDYSDLSCEFIPKKRLKIGTFKISENGYYMGERFFKVIFENAIKNELDEIYVTVYDHHAHLIGYFERFGFKKAGIKISTKELVYVRIINQFADNEYCGYPTLSMSNNRKFILPIRPEYHTRLLPDAILTTEDNDDYIKNNKAGNALKKIYFGRNLWANRADYGDIILFYRTKDDKNASPAHYQSVITSLGVVFRHGEVNDLNKNDLDRLLKKCVLEEKVLQEIQNKPNEYQFIEFVYYGKLDYRRVNLAYMRENGVDAPRGLSLVSDEFAKRVMDKSGYSEGIIRY